jgi:hypothetical protein
LPGVGVHVDSALGRMLLSPGRLRQVLQNVPPRTSGRERRRATRFPRRGSVQMSNVGEGQKPLTVVLQDFSETGVGIIHVKSFCPSEKYLLDLPQDLPGRSVICTVVRCERITDGLFSTGLAFALEAALLNLDPDELDFLALGDRWDGQA